MPLAHHQTTLFIWLFKMADHNIDVSSYTSEEEHSITSSNESWVTSISPYTYEAAKTCTSSCSMITDLQVWYDVAFSLDSGEYLIPDRATINGFVVSIDTNISTSTNTLYARLTGRSGGNQYSYSSIKDVTGAINGSNTFGSPTDTWGYSWSPSYFGQPTNNFGVGINAVVNGDAYGTPFIKVKDPTITVYYTSFFGYQGSTEISYCYIGGTRIKKVFQGSTLIYHFPIRE